MTRRVSVAEGDAEVLVAALLGGADHLAVAVEGREGLATSSA